MKASLSPDSDLPISSASDVMTLFSVLYCAFHPVIANSPAKRSGPVMIVASRRARMGEDGRVTEEVAGEMPRPAGQQETINITVPHSARIWNYWLGGKD